MQQTVKFEIGQQYKNRKGTYEVLTVTGNVMRIRWETGEEADTTTSMQNHILCQIQEELERQALSAVALPPKAKRRLVTRKLAAKGDQAKLDHAKFVRSLGQLPPKTRTIATTAQQIP